jgi:hypothetical protein
MPLLSTRGGLSSRGFGQLNGGQALTLRTFTFPAGSSVFTVPATTNTLVSAVGAGADGSPGGTTTGGFIFVRLVVFNPDPGGTGVYGPTTGAILQAISDGTVSVFNRGGTVYTAREAWSICPNNKYYVNFNYDSVVTRVIPNTATGGVRPTPPSGEILYGDQNYSIIIEYQAEFDYPASTGAATTGFGLTFPGGDGGASSTTSFSNVAVTPNQTYVINNNKSLTITYYA